MISVERILEYVKLPSEPLEVGELKPSQSWPSKGELLFDNVSFSYDKDLPTVLESIQLKINAREKVGIVGRTGAGKSSIIKMLFRMGQLEGNLYIDNVNIKDISLHDLRSVISIIPVCRDYNGY